MNSENEITIIDGTTFCKAKKLEVADSASLFNLKKCFLLNVSLFYFQKSRFLSEL
ncbi:hypothetical protein LEP1GSC086_0593 [Leptospira weilii str. LNT 1234]|nr:hypothetical protein LEP1GSC086_0593 [Leptospira weilii str. LNT 1234]